MLRVQHADGSTVQVAIERLGVQLNPAGGYIEPLPVGRLTGIELEQHPENPTLRTTMGRFQTIYPLDPRSRIVAGEESFTVADVAALALENGDDR